MSKAKPTKAQAEVLRHLRRFGEGRAQQFHPSSCKALVGRKWVRPIADDFRVLRLRLTVLGLAALEAYEKEQN